ncbi:hypothetical protein [Brevibacillus sp. MER 51]|uniref:hypothetical protein n=1 Tax=Brevibacillus sp. MER 51 TaxID=2939560 RepID=UPI00203AB859|nr:hypothetical protein [Brevibacillus sp. MER 51]MCM3145396.1 hypothetical protein [Brevibacillus sp. MER 51]
MNSFEDYLSDSLGLNKNTIKQYIEDIRFYEDKIIEHRANEDCQFFFRKDLLETYLNKRRGATAYSAVVNYLRFLDETNQIDHISFLETKELFSTLYKKNLKFTETFLDRNYIDYIFSGLVHYRFLNNSERNDDQLSVIGPLIWALSYYCGFEQQHLYSLTTDDLRLELGHIRNPYYKFNPTLIEWVKLHDEAIRRINRYREAHPDLFKSKGDTPVLFLDGKRFDNKLANAPFTILNDRVANKDKLPTDIRVNCQILVRSGILHSLQETKGASLLTLSKTIGLDNTQLNYAFNQFLNPNQEDTSA